MFKEHVSVISKSKFQVRGTPPRIPALHWTIKEVMNVMQVLRKGNFMNVLEKSCIYEET
jgi:hypothetical protein